MHITILHSTHTTAHNITASIRALTPHTPTRPHTKSHRPPDALSQLVAVHTQVRSSLGHCLATGKKVRPCLVQKRGRDTTSQLAGLLLGAIGGSALS